MADTYPNIIECENCYLDLSYYNRLTNSIVTARADKNEQPSQYIGPFIVINANDGFTFQNLEEIGSFKWNYGSDTEPKTFEINLSEFIPENEHELTVSYEEIDLNGIYFQAKNLDYSKSKIILKSYQSINLAFVLIGGLNPHKLVIGCYRLDKYSTDGIIKYNNKIYDTTKTHTSYYDPDTGDYGDEFSRVIDLNFKVTTGEVVEDVTNNIFTTYYINTDILNKIRQIGTVPTDIIINTISYPIKFNPDSLTDKPIQTGFITTPINAQIFNKNYNRVDIFKFTVPDIPDVIECIIKIPFNPVVKLEYEDIRGKIITGYITYEVVSDSTTLYVEDDTGILYKTSFDIGINTPYKPTGVLQNYSNTDKRLGVEPPKMIIRGRVKVSNKGNYIKGSIKEPIKDILKDELILLNELLNKGVFIND